jgi:hypothetical protein
VKVYSLDRHVVNAGFGFRKARKDARRSLLHIIAQARLVNYLQDVAKVPVSMLMRNSHAGFHAAYA